MWRVVLLAAIFGGVFTLGVDRLLGPANPVSDAAVESLPEPPPPTLVPIADPGPSRGLVSQVLPTLGVASTAVQYGVYPLRGQGRGPGATFPLVSFTCPADRACDAVFKTIDRLAQAQGLGLVAPGAVDRPKRVLYRALTDGGRPALALRAYPAGPRVSVILTSVGQDRALLEPLSRLDPDITFAVRADLANAPAVARGLTATGREIIAHLPMEPRDAGTDGHPQYLSTQMSVDRLREATHAYLDRVPGAVGADNFRGERLTTSPVHMQAVLSVLGERGVFFFDGRTSDASVAMVTARANGVRVAARTHRLAGDAVTIDNQLKGIEVALALEGQAVVVVEASTTVLGVLPRWLQALRSRRVSLLRLSEIVL